MAMNWNMALDWNRRARPKAEVEKVYQITGAGAGADMSFSASQTEFDYKAAQKTREINNMDLDAMVVCDDISKIVPEETHGDQLLLAKDHAALWYKLRRPPPDGWRNYGSFFGHGIPFGEGQYRAFKQTYVYYKDNQKTNWFMNAYNLIHKNTIQIGTISLCHVIQSHGNYDPRPKLLPTFSAFDQTVLQPLTEELEALIKNPNAFMDVDEYDKSSTWIANGSNENGSPVWEKFTKIDVLGSDGVKVLTLAICHSCNVAYNTGGLKRKSKDSTQLVFKCNGTKAMLKHMEHCGQPHSDKNPQGAPH